jgi:hypothetical protein
MTVEIMVAIDYPLSHRYAVFRAETVLSCQLLRFWRCAALLGFYDARDGPHRYL